MRPSEAEPTVVVIDDDEEIREGLQGLLGSVGLRVELFASVQEYFRLLQQYRPDAEAPTAAMNFRSSGCSGPSGCASNLRIWPRGRAPIPRVRQNTRPAA